MKLASTRLTALSPVLLLGACASSAPHVTAAPASWRDVYTDRLETLALLQSLNADLLSHDSATLTLERWCGAHRLAEPARVVAERVRDVQKPATAEQRKLLQVGADEALGYRRVRLKCGGHVLSEADNWYVPARLTAEMNRALDTSDVAFGRAVQALQFRRRTLSVALLWSPLADGWEMRARAGGSGAPLAIPSQVLQHQAVLTLPDGTPFSNVVETYTSAIFAFR